MLRFKKPFQRRLDRPSWRHFRNGLALATAVAVAVALIEHFGWLYQWQMFSLDTFLKLFTSQPASDIQVVGITDADYKHLFNEQSPLTPGVLESLILKVADERPKVIGVDLDLSSSTLPSCIESELNLFMSNPPPIVWTAVTEEPSPEGNSRLSLKKQTSESIGKAYCGVPLLPLDRDGVVRRYTPELALVDGLRPALFWQVYQLSQGRPLESCDHRAKGGQEEERIISFTTGSDPRGHIDVGTVLDQPADTLRSAFQSKIVLVGGEFSSSRDRYLTPLGERYGVDLIAHAIESEEKGGGAREAGFLAGISLDVAFAVALLLFYHWWCPGYPLITAFTSGIFFPLLISVLLFRYLSLWVGFVPVALSVVIHELSDEIREGRKAEAKLHHLETENRRLHAELTELKQAQAAGPGIVQSSPAVQPPE